MQNTEINEIPPHAPILSLQRDRRIGESPGGWALYQTPSGWFYAGNNADGNDEYIIPMRPDLVQTFRFLAARGKNNSIVEQLEEVLGASDSDAPPKDDSNLPDGEDLFHEEYASDLIHLVPATDIVWASGPDATALVSANGIPYFLHSDFCICGSTAPYVMAHGLLNKDEPAEIQTTFSATGNPCLLVTQGDVSVHFFVCHEELSGKDFSDENRVYVTPIALRGRQNGRPIQAEI